MKRKVHTETNPKPLTFGKPADSGKADQHVEQVVTVQRHEVGGLVPAGNPKNKY